MVAIIDYGAGNLQSVKRAFDYLQVESRIITSDTEMKDVDRVVLPGVGAFGAAVEQLRTSGFFGLIREWLKDDRPFLGICLGMQLLMEHSFESRGIEGFGILSGTCLPFQEGKVPQIGWNQITVRQESGLLNGIPDNAFFYFLHGFYLAPKEEHIVTATTDYGVTYPSIIEKGHMCAVQFHPEKSGDIGLKLLRNWIELC